MTATKQYGTWVKGEEVDIGTMVNLCVDAIKAREGSFPKDLTDTIHFKVAYSYKPALDPDSPDYFPGEMNDSAFTAIKITYEDDEIERETESGSEV